MVAQDMLVSLLHSGRKWKRDVHIDSQWNHLKSKTSYFMFPMFLNILKVLELTSCEHCSKDLLKFLCSLSDKLTSESMNINR